MKTFKDLKIGDPVYYLSGHEIIQESIKSLGNYDRPVEFDTGWVCKTDYDKDATKLKKRYGCHVYCNKSESLMDLKTKMIKEVSMIQR